MDNIKPQHYPPTLLLAGLHEYVSDPCFASAYFLAHPSLAVHSMRVAYWEVAKFAQRLRDAAGPVAGRDILLKTDMSSGHFAASDRYANLRQAAFTYAWALDKLGLGGK